MPLNFVRNDITKLKTDIIVNAANSSLLGGGGVDGAIHKAAGPELLEECRTLGGCPTGDARITKGYKLPAKYVIHTVGPIWQGGRHGEKQLLESCYRNSLMLALKYKAKSIAFPMISAGAYGYPKDEALKIAVSVVEEFLSEHEMNITLVVFDKASFDIGKGLYNDIKDYIGDNYDFPVYESRNIINEKRRLSCDCTCTANIMDDLEDRIKTLDESFSQMILRLIDEKNLTDSQCYKKANIDRKLFSKIRSDKNYKPSKQTAAAFIFAFPLNMNEAQELMEKAGFAISHSSVFDVIIEFCIMNRIYDIHRVNSILFSFDQPLLGSRM